MMSKPVKSILVCIVICFAFLIISLLYVSPKTTASFLDDNGQELENSIAEIRDIELNGIQQRILIRGADKNNPILLNLHGGPGGPDQTLLQSSGKTVEDIFTVVYWDQRGAGASYSSEIDIEQLSLAQIVKDGNELARLLIEEFKQDKIFLQGHSWGTLVGLKMAAKNPELFKAFISVGQLVHAVRAEVLSFDFALGAAQSANDQATVRGLTELGRPPYKTDQKWIDSVLIQRAFMMPYELPGKAPLFSMVDTYKSFIFYRGYSIRDKLSSLKGFETSLPALWMEVINTDLFSENPSIDVPVYFIQGKYDQHTVTQLVEEYHSFVTAPKKEYIEFSNSAHWPHLREFEKYRSTLKLIKSQH